MAGCCHTFLFAGGLVFDLNYPSPYSVARGLMKSRYVTGLGVGGDHETKLGSESGLLATRKHKQVYPSNRACMLGELHHTVHCIRSVVPRKTALHRRTFIFLRRQFWHACLTCSRLRLLWRSLFETGSPGFRLSSAPLILADLRCD